MRIAVIGGGISGLTTAFQLQKTSGTEVHVFESGQRVGGNIQTESLAGCRVEWGPNGFLDNEPATLDLVRELGLEHRLVRAREEAASRFVWRAGKLRKLPHSPPAFLAGDCLPLGARLRVMRELFFVPSAPEGEESVFAFAARHFGNGAAEILVDAMVSGIYAGDPRRLSLAHAFPRLHELAKSHGSLLLASARNKSATRPTLCSFDEGMEVVTRALARELDVRTGVHLESIPEGYDHVVCTVPAPRAAPLLEGAPELQETLRGIPFAPLAVVALAFDQSLPVPHAFGFLAPRGQGLRILGTVYESSVFPNRAPEDQRLFRVMIGGRHDPEVVKLSDSEILEVVEQDLRTVWGTFPEPRLTHVMRHSLGIAQPELGHGERLASLEAASPPRLRLAGSSYRGVAFNACIREARSWAPPATGDSAARGNEA